jgi:hypothetical protein
MSSELHIQASGAQDTGVPKFPPEWSFVFAVRVTDENGTPIKNLTKNNFSLWNAKDLQTPSIKGFLEPAKETSQKGLDGVYRIETNSLFFDASLAPVEVPFVIHVKRSVTASTPKNPRGSTPDKAPKPKKVKVEGAATVTVTFWGQPKSGK